MRNSETYQTGKKLSESVNPGMEAVLQGRYDKLVPGFSETVVDVAYGNFYARDGLDIKTRYLCTIAALTAIGGQTSPQLKVNILGALNSGATKAEISEAIFQMALYGGFPSMVNAMNSAIEVFEAEDSK